MNGINLDNLTLGQLREIAKLTGCAASGSAGKKSSLLKPGDKVFIRTVTLYFTGEVTQITDSEIELKDAAWIADTKRFADFLKNGVSQGCEVEPYPDGVILNRDVVIDMSRWPHELPRKQQ